MKEKATIFDYARMCKVDQIMIVHSAEMNIGLRRWK